MFKNAFVGSIQVEYINGYIYEGKMRKKHILHIIIGTLILICISLMLNQLNTLKEPPFFVRVTMGSEEENINLWESEKSVYYVFLPAYARTEKVSICMKTSVPVYCDGQLLYDGMLCDVFLEGNVYDLTFYNMGKKVTKQVVFLYSENIATMFIDTDSGNMDYIHEEKGNSEKGNLRLYNADGSMDCFSEIESINGRGNATWTDSDKKPYSVKFTNEADLLEMGAAQNWILLANSQDASNIRNKLVYDFAKDFGLAYSPDSEWVDLYLNGEYAGLYLLCERNEVHPERVNIGLEGSFLVSLELESRLLTQGYPYALTKEKQAFRIRYPKEVTSATKDELTSKLQSIENAIIAENNVDPITGRCLEDLIDLDSWVRKYLVEEVFGNTDASTISQYFYSDGINGKVYAGPVWDYDYSMGTKSVWQITDPKSFLGNRAVFKDGIYTPWFSSLYSKDFFFDKMLKTYSLELLPLINEYVDKQIPAFKNTINQVSKMNEIRWSTDALDEEIEYIVDYLDKRITFFNNVWINNDSYKLVVLKPGFEQNYAYYAVRPGERLDYLPTFDDTETHTFLGWYYSDTDEPFDITKPITEDIEIYAKWEEKPSNRIKQVLKLAPLGVIGIMGVAFLVADYRRNKRNG